MFKPIKSYLFLSGLLAHILFAIAVAFILWIKLHDHWRVEQFRNWIQGPLDNTLVYQADLDALPINQWIKIHQMTSSDDVVFERQRHSGSAFDSKRNRLLIFGSDTHGDNWDNSIYAFDLNTRSWSAIYSQTALSSYGVTLDGIPHSDTNGARAPWAMHAFDAINYDPINDRLVVASKPEHLKPGRFTNKIDTDLWNQITTHPTWSFNLTNKHWKTLAADHSKHFFPYATAYSTAEGAIFGFRPDGVFKLNPDTERWNKVARSNINAYHTQAVWDEHNNAFIIAGNQNLSNDTHIYRPGETSTRKMPTQGQRPNGFQHSPMAYHASSKTAALVIDATINGNDQANTWLYNLKTDRWQQLPNATLPFHLGMSYHMQYSSELDALMLFLQTTGSKPSVWLLRLKTP